MPKRSAAEAFSGKPISAFAKARAGRPAAAESTTDPTSSTTTFVATDGAVDVIESKPPLLERHETFGYSVETVNAVPTTVTNGVAPSDVPLSSYGKRALKLKNGIATLTLEANEWVSASGVFDLVVSKGAVSIYGAYITSSETANRVCAPLSHALPTIRARHESEIEFRSVDCALLELEALSSLWNRIWHKWEDCTFAIASNAPTDVLSLQASTLDLDEVAQKALNRLSSHSEVSSRTLVAGSKSSGKSTFCRCLSNAIVSSSQPELSRTCFWLDLDPGQPEFSPPGQIALIQVRGLLLGPSFSHPRSHPALPYRTIRAHSIAATSPREDQDHYIACVNDLYQRYAEMKSRNQDATLIINCPGWITGSGAVLSERIAKILNVTDVIMLESPDFQNDPVSFPASAKVKVLTSRGRTSTTRPSAEARAMQTMSYQHTVDPTSGQQTWTSQPLSAIPSLHLSYAGTNQLIHAITSYHTTIPPSALPDVLTGLPVALVIASSPAAFTSSPTTNPTTPAPVSLPYLPPSSSGNSPPLDPTHSHCIGQALVRSIDPDKKEIHLVTPVSEAEIHYALSKTPGGKGRLVLVRGKLDSPDWAILEDVYRREYRVKHGVVEEEKGADWDLDEEDEEEDEVAGVGEGKKGKGFVPYVSVRQVRGGQEEGNAGEILSERVWRPRHLPRNNR
ncbi:hypothetical protein BDZ85DRAFT_226907 [Elsinoe ampelina]|uniref:Polynucleotide 5'-hydroxyl-kinase GRC3 n=1 Tax=Elsinoe ampelina TaxID=302913 RepID=A0A6A6FYF9_9PEZI|nr:hypothetical protein BDZ85DRAFT_226907 [Elsinoe ampelina]